MIDTPPDVERAVARPPAEEQGALAAQAGPPIDDDMLLRMSTDAYKASTDYFETSIRREIETDLRHWQGRHATNSKYASPSYAGRSKLFTPKTRAAVLKSEAKAAEAFFSSIDVLNITAYDRDDELQEGVAKFYKALLQRRLTDAAPVGMPWYLTAMGAYQDAHVTGVAVSMQYWQLVPSRGLDRPMVDLVPLENFRFDPAADWRDPVATSPYLVYMIPMYVKDVRRRINEGKYRPMSDEELLTASRRYSDSIRLQREGQRADPADVTHAITDFSIVWVHMNIVEIDGVDLLYYTLNESKMLSVQAVPLQTQFPQGRPFVVGFSTIETHKHYPSGIPRLTRDTQRELNDLRNQRIDNVSFVLNKRYFVRRNQQVDLASITRNVPGSSTLMNDPDKDVRVVETPDVTSSSYQEQDRLNLDFDDVAGTFSNSSVQSNRKLNETVGGMNMLSGNANQIDAYRLRTFVETWVEPVLRQLLELERNLESNEDIILYASRAVGADGMPPDEVWDMPAVVQVNVGMSATNPQEKASLMLYGFTSIRDILADGVLEQRGLDTQEVVAEIFAMLGYRDGSRFFKFAGDGDPRVAQMMAKIEQLQAALDAKHPPELIAAQVRKLDAESLGRGVGATYEAMQAGQVIAAVPSVAPIADEVMKAAGWQPSAGADPNFPQPAAPDPAITQGTVMDPRTGVEFNPAAANPAVAPGPDTAGVGSSAGIQTARPDGVAR